MWSKARMVSLLGIGALVMMAGCSTCGAPGANVANGSGTPTDTIAVFPPTFTAAASPPARTPTDTIPVFPPSVTASPTPPSPLAAPIQLSPANGSSFSTYPRTTTLHWQPVAGAASYGVAVDYYQSGNTSCTGGTVFLRQSDLTQPTVTFDFVGAQSGCWQVWAVTPSGQPGQSSPWWEFSYTV